MIDKNIFFLHIPRTMGTTLKNIFLTPHYQSGKMLLNLEWPPAIASKPSHYDQFKFISGHIGWNIESVAGGEWERILMLRDPYQRSWSMWNFVQSIPKHYLHIKAKGMTLLQFARSPETNFLIRNMQARYIANDTPYEDIAYWIRTLSRGDPSTPGVLDEHFEKMLLHLNEDDLLEAAKHNVDKALFTGISEQFYDSTHKLWKTMKVNPLPMTEGLASHFHPLSSSEADAIEELNQVDLRLYAYATEKLNASL